MTEIVPVTVIIPTYGRGTRVFVTLQRIAQCDPIPQEILVHIDSSDGTLARELSAKHPNVRILESPHRRGPGGGRHICISHASNPYIVSLDDDSYPYDDDFFGLVVALFTANPDAMLIDGTVWHRNEDVIPRDLSFVRCENFVGCGHALRLGAYQKVFGYVPRPVAYGVEESDLALQMHEKGLFLYKSRQLRVFHDTTLTRHNDSEVTAYSIANIALLAFLRYPILCWPIGLLQILSRIAYSIRVARYRGIISGIMRIPYDCYAYRSYRRPVKLCQLLNHIRLRRLG